LERFFAVGGYLRTLSMVERLTTQPLWLQFVVLVVFKDFLEWLVHNLLHRVEWLWQFHKLHHSIQELDWIGNMRFHWMEIVLYKSLTYLPLVVLGIDGGVILWVAITGTLIGHLNHANLNTWGPISSDSTTSIQFRRTLLRRLIYPFWK
jgi:sterol desaturase/sphingolipid hydroxylase (fatty acid hydroxylase superfamily)